jgi:hypothetical protein
MSPIPDMNAILPGCEVSTWRDKKNLCYLEGRTYAEDGVPIDANPYIRGTWPWYWFNEAYMEHADCTQPI